MYIEPLHFTDNLFLSLVAFPVTIKSFDYHRATFHRKKMALLVVRVKMKLVSVNAWKIKAIEHNTLFIFDFFFSGRFFSW